MTTASSNPVQCFRIISVNFAYQLEAMLDRLHGLPASPPSLYLNITGLDHGSSATTLKMAIASPQLSEIYTLNLDSLGHLICSAHSSQNITLKSVLESSTITKVFFDGRQASAALFNGYGIRLCQVHEIQMMELATRRDDHHKERLASWQKLIEQEQVVLPLWKKDSSTYFSDQRVLSLPQLWSKYHRRLTVDGTAFWVAMVRQATKERLLSTQPHDRTKNVLSSQSPWYEELIQDERDTWNDDVCTQAWYPDYGMDYSIYRHL